MKLIEPKEQHIDLNGRRFHYLDWGNNEEQSLFLLHGFMGHAHVWDDFALIFRKDYHVIALDQRGHGESQWSKEAAYTIYDYFLNISSFVETLQMGQFILMGHSMGGRNALFYAACSPQKVEKLILVDARPRNNPKGSEELRRHLIHLSLMANSFDEVGKAIQTLYPCLSEEICQQIARYGYKKGQDGKYVLKCDARMGLDSERSGYIVEDLWPFLKNVNSPTLIIRGKDSPFLSLEEARKMCHLIPKAELKEIPQATHMPLQENFRVFVGVVSQFLRSKKQRYTSNADRK